MSASTTGGKTVTRSIAPHLSASLLTTILGTALENLTVAQFDSIHDALKRIPKSSDPTAIIGTLFI